MNSEVLILLDSKIIVENVNHPGKTSRVDRVKYEAMKIAVIAALPAAAPGLTQTQCIEAVKAHLPQELFPNGEKSAWWFKSVQLDMEAKRLLTREASKPLRWHLA